MSPARAQEDGDRRSVKDILYQATLLPSSSRSSYVQRACGDEVDLRAEVESLLRFNTGQPLMMGTATSRSLERPAPWRYAVGCTIAGRYRVVGRIGRGGMGEVYAVDDQVLELQVALKALRAVDEQRRRRMLEEVRLARRVSHRSICRVHDFGEADGVPYLTMELIEGEDLEARVHRLGPLPSLQVARIGYAVAQGLAVAHAAGVLHRDLKPANVILDRFDRAHLTDFGISSSRPGNLRVDGGSPSSVGLGTPSYMAPEQLEPAAASAGSEKSDLYSLGALLYHLLTGSPPYDADDVSVLRDQQRLGSFDLPSRRGVAVDLALESCVVRLLSVEPARRPGSAARVAAVLASVARGERAGSARRRDRIAMPVVSWTPRVMCRKLSPLDGGLAPSSAPTER